MAIKKFPQTIYLAQDEDGDDDSFFIEYDDIEELHNRDGEKVGIYKLVEVRKVNVKVDVNIDKKVKG